MQERIAQQQRLMLVSSALSKAGISLCAKVATTAGNCAYEFELLAAHEKNGANAFTDGNKISITPSMMRFARRDEELAIVLSHELAHAMLGHSQAKSQHSAAGLLMGAVLDSLASSQGFGSNDNFRRAGAEIGTLVYSADFEREADYVGLYIMARAGYAIAAAPDFWRKMSLKKPASFAVSTTHPSNPERTVLLEKTVAEIMTKKHHGQLLDPEWKPAAGEAVHAANPYVMKRR